MKAAGAALFVFPIRLFFQKNRLARKFSIKTGEKFSKISRRFLLAVPFG